MIDAEMDYLLSHYDELTEEEFDAMTPDVTANLERMMTSGAVPPEMMDEARALLAERQRVEREGRELAKQFARELTLEQRETALSAEKISHDALAAWFARHPECRGITARTAVRERFHKALEAGLEARLPFRDAADAKEKFEAAVSDALAASDGV